MSNQKHVQCIKIAKHLIIKNTLLFILLLNYILCSFQCKYTAFKALDSCKKDNHFIKTVEAIKRFFKCTKCKNRMTTISKFPVDACKYVYSLIKNILLRTILKNSWHKILLLNVVNFYLEE